MTVERIQLTDDYSISRILNGCWQLSPDHSLNSPLDMSDVMYAFNLLAEEGITTFDCADIYTGSEEFLGKFLKQLSSTSNLSPNDIQIHTKYVPDINILEEVDFAYTEKIIDRSLQRLGVDQLDVVQFHWWDYEVPGMLETASDLVKLKEKGKIRYLSVTNFDTPHLQQLTQAGIPVLSNQAQYSIFDRRPEKTLVEFSQKENIALICYGALSGGLLSEKWVNQAKISPETRSHVKYLQVIEDTFGWNGYQDVLSLLRDIANQYGVEIPHVAVRYILDKSGVTASVIGVRNSRHAKSNMRIFDFELSQEDIIRIDTLVNQFQNLKGEPFELERTPGSKYTQIMKMNITEGQYNG